jgi:hypothetical protein
VAYKFHILGFAGQSEKRFVLNRPEVMVPFAQDRIKDGTVTDQKTRDLIRQLLGGLVMWATRLQRGMAAQEEKTVKAA